MSVKINNPYRGFFKRCYTSAFSKKRNPEKYEGYSSSGRRDSYNFNSTYNTLLSTSYSSGFVKDITSYAKSLGIDEQPELLTGQSNDFTGVKSGYRSKTVSKNQYYSGLIKETRQEPQDSGDIEETDINSLIFEMKSKMNYYF